MPSIKNDHPELFQPVNDKFPSVYNKRKAFETCPPLGKLSIFKYPKDNVTKCQEQKMYLSKIYFDLKNGIVMAISNGLSFATIRA